MTPEQYRRMMRRERRQRIAWAIVTWAIVITSSAFMVLVIWWVLTALFLGGQK